MAGEHATEDDADAGARRYGEDGPPGRRAPRGARAARAHRLSGRRAPVRLGGRLDVGCGAGRRRFGVPVLLPRPRGPGRGRHGGIVRRGGRSQRCVAPGASGRPPRARARARGGRGARLRCRAHDPPVGVVHAELQRGLPAGGRPERPGRPPGRRHTGTVRRCRRCRRRRGRSADGGRPRRGAVRAHGPTAHDLLRGHSRDRRGQWPGDRLRAGFARAVRGRRRGAGGAHRVRPAADLPVRGGSGRAQRPARRTGSSEPWAGGRESSPTTPATPPRAASGALR